MIRVTCSSCQKPMSIDEAKLPMREVSFPCPACKARITVDRRTLGPEDPSPAAAAPAPAPAAPAVLQGTMPQTPVPADLDEDDELGPRALIAGVDTPALREACRTLGFQAFSFPTIEECRDFYLQEHPRLVFLNPAQLTPPPLADFQALTLVSPADRRKGYFILVSENLKTFDGTAAFLYGVNLVLAARDLPAIRRIYAEADAYHRRMYESFQAALEAKGTQAHA
ncbi:MAG TPA: hypothetical protein VHN15_02530 [Thermoanaerobaculia bacterium]|nr:hypothetical protein [Thermoanaerobaculia bacterium]